SVLLHGVFLVSANMFSAIVSFVVVQVLTLPSDRIIQSSIALIINLGIYFAVYKLMFGVQKEIMKIDNFSMFAILLLISMALLPSIFYPLHFLTQGYWSSVDNLLAIWPYQLIVNGLCLVLNFYILRSKKA
ncbi:MAG: hypothetical protein KAI29_31290, partial [Cyclobacteriaceae bacterium]|nr:hypothetical protein [Cyclobacteriaceae bacterium]